MRKWAYESVLFLTLTSVYLPAANADSLFAHVGSLFRSASSHHSKLPERISKSYTFNQYLDVETGYSDSEYMLPDGSNLSGMKYSLKSIDLVGKAYLPLHQRGLKLYGVGGAAAVSSNVAEEKSGTVSEIGAANGRATKKIRPKFGVGMDYHMTSQFSTSVEYARVQGVGDPKLNSNALENADSMTFNFTYDFN